MGEQETLPDEFFTKEVQRIMDEAEKANVIIRVIGSLAIRLHSEGYQELHKKLGRLGKGNPSFSDIDVMAYSKQSTNVMTFFEKMGFTPDKYAMLYFGPKRLVYYHSQNCYHVDVFFDKLEFSHDVNFGKEPEKGRLEIDTPTISLADLLLEKLQIHQINEKDIKDLIILFLAHELGENDEKNTINARYVAEILADDWGFWYDATENLKKILHFASKYNKDGLLSDREAVTVRSKVDRFLVRIENEPKTKKWQQRAKKGAEKKWYRDVEESMRT